MHWFWRVIIVCLVAWVAWFAIMLKIDSGLNLQSTNRFLKALMCFYPIPGRTHSLVWPLVITGTVLLAGLILYGIMVRLVESHGDAAAARSRLRRVLMMNGVLALLVETDWLHGGSWAVMRTTRIGLMPSSQPGVAIATSMQSVWSVERLNKRYWLPVQKQFDQYRLRGLLMRSLQVPVPHWMLIAVLAIPTLFVMFFNRPRLPGHCQHCGYDLTGNVSGVCPECGTAVVTPEDKPLLP